MPTAGDTAEEPAPAGTVAAAQPGDDPDKQAKLAASMGSVPIFKDCDPAFVESCSELVRQMS